MLCGIFIEKYCVGSDIMKYNFKQIINSYTKEKRKRSSIWARIFSRPMSFVFTYIFINLGVSANVVSVISIIDALIACFLIMMGGEATFIGIVLFVFWHVLDCVDGNIARVKKESSYGGAFLDAVSGYIAPAFIFLSVGVAAYLTSGIPSEYKHFLIVIGGFCSVTDILTRIIYQKYLVTEYRLGLMGKSGDIDNERASGIKHIADLVMKHMGYSSLFMPLLIVCSIFGWLDILIALYFAYYVALLISTVCLFVMKASKLEERVEALGLEKSEDIKEF